MSSPRQLSLAGRLTAWFALSTVLVVAAATALLYWGLVGSLDRQDHYLLADRLEVVRAILREEPTDFETLRNEVEWEWSSGPDNHFFARILDSNGTVLAVTPSMPAELTPARFPAASGSVARDVHGLELGADAAATVASTVVQTADGASYRLMAALASVPGAQPLTVQLVWEPLPEARLLSQFRRRIWLILGMAMLLASIIGHAIARRGVRPIARIAAAMRRADTDTLHERVAIAGLPSELHALAVTYNDMQSRLQDSFERIETFSANIAHELRTPLTNLRGALEVALGKARTPEAYRATLESSLEECERLTRILDRLLFLARANAGAMAMAREPLDPALELGAVREFFDPAATEAQVGLVVVADRGLTLTADRVLLRRALSNLVSNALTHTAAGGTITLRAGLTAAATIRIEVTDDGAGMAPEHATHAFERFYRADVVRDRRGGGVGLGLPIVSSIVRLHGGSATLDSAVGRGTTVRLDFPAEPGDQSSVGSRSTRP